MSALTELQKLVHSMTMNEKRYFRIQVEKEVGEDGSGKQPAFLRLFDLIYHNTEKPEEELIAKLKRTDFYSNLSFTQTYLRTQIIRVLQSYRFGKTTDLKIYQLLSELTILTDNQLVNQSVKTFKRLRTLAEKEMRVDVLPEVYRWNATFLARGWIVDKYDKKAAQLRETRNGLFELLKLETQLNELQVRIRNCLFGDRDVRESSCHTTIQSIIDELEAMIPPQKYTDFFISHQCHNLFLCYFCLGEYEKSLEILDKQFAHFAWIEEKNDSGMYLKNPLANLYEANLMALNLDKLPEIWERQEKYVKSRMSKFTILQRIDYKMNREYRKIRKIILRGFFDEERNPIEKSRRFLERNKIHIQVFQQIHFGFVYLVVYFYRGDFDAMRKGIDQVLLLTSKKQSAGDEFVIKCRILEMMALAEEGDKSALKSEVNSFQRVVNKFNFDPIFENIFITLMQSLIKSKGIEKNKSSAFQTAYESLMECKSKHKADWALQNIFNMSLYYKQGAEGFRAVGL